MHDNQTGQHEPPCEICGTPGEGPECNRCFVAEDLRMARRADR